MKAANWMTKIPVGALGLLPSAPGMGLADGGKKDPAITNPPGEEQHVGSRFSKEELIRSLRDMNRNPERLQLVCAMCYEPGAPPRVRDFRCDRCGRSTVYAEGSDQATLVGQLPYIKRSLSSMPYSISLDSIGLCSYCGKNRARVIVAHGSCFSCGKLFSWEISNRQDIDDLSWLFLAPPINKIDFPPWRSPERGGEQGLVKKGARYIHDHVFCPECRREISIEEGER